MFGYSAAVRSLSQGRASFSMEPLRYGPRRRRCRRASSEQQIRGFNARARESG